MMSLIQGEHVKSEQQAQVDTQMNINYQQYYESPKIPFFTGFHFNGNATSKQNDHDSSNSKVLICCSSSQHINNFLETC